MKSKTLLLLYFVGAIASYSHNKDARHISVPQGLSGYVEAIEADSLLGGKIKYDILRVDEKRYKVKLNIYLKENMPTHGWEIKIKPGFVPNFHWAPHLTPVDGYIISDHVFRAPAVIFASNDKTLTLIPDLNERAKSQYRWYMDYDTQKNVMSIGISDYVVKEHVLFAKKDTTVLEKGNVSIAFYLMTDNDKESVDNPWRKPLAFMWNNYGKTLAEQSAASYKPMEPYVRHTYEWAFDTWKDAVWQAFELNGVKVGAPAFIVNYTQSPNYKGKVDEREFRSIWNQAWFSSLRSAQGLWLYGKQTGNDDFVRRANMTKELALAFPQSDGLFPGLIATEMENVKDGELFYNRSKGWQTYYFGNSNRNPYTDDPKLSPLHILDMSCTAFYMLNWYEQLEKDERLLTYSKAYAEKLLTYQDADGFFPAWIDSNHNPLDILKQSPETSKSVSFLLKLYKLTNKKKYFYAAEKAMEAVMKNIIPTGRWEDFETYYSCSSWGRDSYVGKKIERNDMFKQNTLSIYWTAEALLAMYEQTGRDDYLKMGRRTLDELLMAQAVWQPPYMYVPVFGGFGVMNADGEWNDSRQALFSELIIRYGKTLNSDEYIQRGILALKSSFFMMYCSENAEAKKQWEIVYPFFNKKDYGFMMENYGHGGYTGADGGGIGVFTIYDWGNGNASNAYNFIVHRYGKDFFNTSKK